MEGQRPLVSIIVRTKDRPKLLKKALASIGAQTYRPLEVVVVNDGGCDLDADELKETLGDAALNYIRLENNSGRAHAGNVGIRSAKGRYVGFLDDDDEFRPEHVATLVPLLEQLDYQVAYSDCLMVYKEYDPLALEMADRDRELLFSRDFDYDFLLFENYIPFMCLLFRKQALEEAGGIDEGLELYEDWDLLIRIGAGHPFFHVRKTTALYNQWASDMQIAQKNRDAAFVEESYARVLSKHRGRITEKRMRHYISCFVEARSSVAALEGRLEKAREEARSYEERITRLGSTLQNQESERLRLHGLVTSLESRVEQGDSRIANLESVLGDREGKIEALESMAREKESTVNGLAAAVRDGEMRLARIYDSTGWKMLLVYYRLRDKVFPPHSRRRVILKAALKVLRRPASLFRNLSLMNLKKFLHYFKNADASLLEAKIGNKLFGDGRDGNAGAFPAPGLVAVDFAATPERKNVLLIGGPGSEDSGAARSRQLSQLLAGQGYAVTEINDTEGIEGAMQRNGGFSFVFGMEPRSAFHALPLLRAYSPLSRFIYYPPDPSESDLPTEMFNASAADMVMTDSPEVEKRFLESNSTLKIAVVPRQGEDAMLGALLASLEEAVYQKPESDPSPGTPAVKDAQPLPVASDAGKAGGAKSNVLVIGVYLANQENALKHLVEQLGRSRNYIISQRWAALGGNPPSAEVDAVTVLKIDEFIPKNVLLNRLVAEVELDRYDYVIVCDDDIILPENFTDIFLGLQSRFDFAAAQPARTHNSYIDHFFVEVLDGLLARRTKFVEIGPLVSFRGDLLSAILPFDEKTPMGWGFDFVLPYIAEKKGLRVGIVDAAPVDHSMRKPMHNYRYEEAKKAMDDYLASHPHFSRDEAFTILEAFA